MILRPFLLPAVISIGLAFLPRGADAGDRGRWTVSRFAEPPVTWDGMHVTEGTSTATKWAWRARINFRYHYDIGLARRSSQFVLDQLLGLGFPLRLDAGVALPAGITVGSKAPSNADPSARVLQGMGEDGAGVGDLIVFLLWSALDANDGGMGLLLGLKAGMPTGNHDRLLGEGWFTVEPLVSLAFQIFGSRLSLNLGYLARPEHLWVDGERRFEQDDDVLWGVGVRIPRENDMAWAIEVEGGLGVATDEGGWPSRGSRPVALCGGVDFPLGRLHRMALTAGFGLAGIAPPTFTAGMTVLWLPVPPDEDKDGVRAIRDECPLLKEDRDGFMDEDGCPDLDNDSDGFPDDEDLCPLEAAGDFSEDGCPDPL